MNEKMKRNEFYNHYLVARAYLNPNIVNYEAIIIYGAGHGGVGTLIKLNDGELKGKVKCFCDADKNKQGKAILGIPVVSPEELRMFDKNSLVIITPEKAGIRVTKILKDYGFHHIIYTSGHHVAFVWESEIWDMTPAKVKNALVAENREKIEYVLGKLWDQKSKEILEARLDAYLTGNYGDLEKYFEKEQYFPKDIIHLHDSEVFVDCGALGGETSGEFVQKTAGKYGHLYMFEPDPLNYELTKAYILLESIKDADVFSIGVSRDEGTISFVSELQGSSHIAGNGEATTMIQVNSLDNVLYERPYNPTYIKMDIEGAEMDAMAGAQMIISRDRPKLAISAYHKPEDMWDIPYWIMQLNLGYKVYLRQHAPFTETVCYGV
jgi:FkbM family methyltransferase